MSKRGVSSLVVSGLFAVTSFALVGSGACSSSSNSNNAGDGGGGNGGDSGSNGESAGVGPMGGNFPGPNGFDLSIPAGALSNTVTVQVAALTPTQYPSNMPRLPSSWTLQSAVYSFQPHGQQFATPVSIDLPYSGVSGASVVTAEPSGSWSVMPGAGFGADLATFTTKHFSFYAVVTMGTGSGSGASGSSGGGNGSSSSNSSTTTTPDCGDGCTNSAGSCVNNVCMCPTGYSTCGNTCVNEQLDDANCGGCGISCAESCIAGECQVTLSSSESAVALAVDANNLYWVNSSGSVVMVAIAGGSTTTLASANSPQSIALDSDNVYWTTGDGSIQSLPKMGGTSPQTIASGQSGVLGLAVQGTFVFWGAQGDAQYEIRSAPTSGTGKVSIVATSSGAAYGMALDPTHVYWTTKSGLFSALAFPPKPDAGPKADAGPPPQPTSVASGGGNGVIAFGIDSSDAYWGSFAAGGGTVQKVALTGGSATQLAGGQNGPNGLANDGTKVYWTTQEGLVLTVPIGGGSVATLASTSNGGTGIVVDGTTVYWASGNTVQKITPK